MAGEAAIITRIQNREPVSYGDILTLATAFSISLTATANSSSVKDKNVIVGEVRARIGNPVITIYSWAT